MKKSATKQTRFGSGILADSAHRDETGKVSCSGMFSIIWAWAFPCTRSGNIVANIFGLPSGNTSVGVSIKNRYKKTDSKSIAMVDVAAKEDNGAVTFIVPFNHQFEAEGKYDVVLSFRDYPNRLRIPFEVRKRAWPIFSQKEIRYAKNHPESNTLLRINVHCSSCKHAYIFEENIAGDTPSGGVMEFPKEGVFICEECGKELYLKDLQGQLRQSLRDNFKMGSRRK